MEKTYSPIKVILADDHEIYRDGFNLLFRKSHKIKVIAEACDGNELIDLARKLNPDVIITDIKMPVKNGIEATAQLTKEMPHIGVIALSMFDDDDLIVDMLQAGASGYLLKNAHKDEMFAAIDAVYEHKTYYCRDTTKILSRLFAESHSNSIKKTYKAAFNENELIVIQMICKEYSNQEIADSLELSRRTIEGYRVNILKKINARNTAGIVIYAIKNNLFGIPGSVGLN